MTGRSAQGVNVINLGQGDTVAVNAVQLDWQGQPVEGEFEWRLVEEDYWFDWYRENGEWRWRRSFRDVLDSAGQLSRQSELLRVEVGRFLSGTVPSQIVATGSSGARAAPASRRSSPAGSPTARCARRSRATSATRSRSSRRSSAPTWRTPTTSRRSTARARR